MLVQPGRYAGASLRAMDLNAAPANPCRSLLQRARESSRRRRIGKPSASRSSDFSRADEQCLARNCAAGFQIQRSGGRGQAGIKVALVDVDADADHGKGNRSCPRVFDSTRMPPTLRGPISRSLGQRRSTVEPATRANRLGSGQSRGQRKQRQAAGGNLRAQQHAHVKPFARRRVPGVIAAPAAGQLLIGKVDRAVRRAAARGIQGVGVGRIGDRQKNAACRQRWCRQARPPARPDRYMWLGSDSAANAHGDVGGLGGVGQRAHADEVHAGLGIGANVFKHDAARGFGGNPALSRLASRFLFLMRSTDRFTCSGVMLSSRIASAPNSSASSSSCAVRTSTCTRWPFLRFSRALRQHRGQAAAQRDVVVLDQNSARPDRGGDWCRRRTSTAYFSSARRPGTVLRVSSTRACVP